MIPKSTDGNPISMDGKPLRNVAMKISRKLRSGYCCTPKAIKYAFLGSAENIGTEIEVSIDIEQEGGGTNNVKTLAVYEDRDRVYHIMEWLDGPELYETLKDKEYWSEEQLRKYLPGTDLL